MLNTVEKCGEILDLFSPDRPEWGVTEMGEALGMAKSSAHALAASLNAIGLLTRTGSGRYRLGWRIPMLNRLLMETTECREVGMEAMRRLALRFGETVHLGVLRRTDVLFIERAGGSRAIDVPLTGVGEKKPAAGIAIGKALLACEPWGTVRTWYDTVSSTSPEPAAAELEVELSRVRREHCAFNLATEICAVGAPIWDAHDQVVAGLSMSFPIERVRGSLDTYAQAVRGAADWISDRLGASGNGAYRWRQTTRRVSHAI